MTRVRVPGAYRDAMCARLKAARKAAGYTQESFAELLGLDEKTYAKYESRSLLPHPLIGRVCRLLDIDAFVFLDGFGRDAARPQPSRIK